MNDKYIDIDSLKDKYYPKLYSKEYSDVIATVSPYMKSMDNKYNRSNIAKTITIQVTEACNLNCSYCYQINKSPAKMNFETAKKFIELILTDDQNKNSYMNKYNADYIVLDFIGGEPLLEIDLIDKIVDYFIKRCIELNHPWLYGYMISIGTNGTLYFDKKVQKFISKHQNRISMNITVDGDKELHDSCRVFYDGRGSYDLASAAVKDWIKRTNGNSKSTKLTIAPENLKYLKNAIINMVDIGFEFINENCVYEDVWNKDLAKELYYQLKDIADWILDNNLESKVNLRILNPDSYRPISPVDNSNWCGGDGSMLAVDVHGDLFNCIRYMKSSLGNDQEPLVIGNVDYGIGQTELHKRNIAMMKCITRYSQSSEKCFWCPIARGCGWCSALNYQLFGTPNKRTTTTCDMHIAASLASNYYWNKVLIKNNDNKRLKLYTPKEWAISIIEEDEYNMILNLSNSEIITEKEWYEKYEKPIKVSEDGKITLLGDYDGVY